MVFCIGCLQYPLHDFWAIGSWEGISLDLQDIVSVGLVTMGIQGSHLGMGSLVLVQKCLRSVTARNAARLRLSGLRVGLRACVAYSHSTGPQSA